MESLYLTVDQETRNTLEGKRFNYSLVKFYFSKEVSSFELENNVSFFDVIDNFGSSIKVTFI